MNSETTTTFRVKKKAFSGTVINVTGNPPMPAGFSIGDQLGIYYRVEHCPPFIPIDVRPFKPGGLKVRGKQVSETEDWIQRKRGKKWRRAR